MELYIVAKSKEFDKSNTTIKLALTIKAKDN